MIEHPVAIDYYAMALFSFKNAVKFAYKILCVSPPLFFFHSPSVHPSCDKTVLVTTDCQLIGIWNHLGDTPLCVL